MRSLCCAWRPQPSALTRGLGPLLVESAQVGLCVVQDERLTYHNPMFASLFGYASGRLAPSASLLDLAVEADRALVMENVLRPLQQAMDSVQYTFRGRRKDGTTFDVQIHGVRATISGRAAVMATVLDVTEGMRIEREWHELSEELFRANRELEQFAYLASHDLQEPLRKLIAFSGLLREDIGGALSESAASDLHFITDAAQRMQRLIQDLLALSRVREGNMKVERVALGACADAALEAVALRVEERKARIVRDALPEVTGDRTMLTQLYQNLIGNALKFVGKEPPVLHVTAEQIDGRWVFGIRDNGIGLKPEYAEQIFLPFKRLHTREEYEGTGIGLAICQKAVDLHGGRIWVESAGPGHGAHFKFTLRGEQGERP